MTLKGKSAWIHKTGQRLAQHLANKTSDAHLTKQVHYFHPKEVYLNPARDKVARCAPFPLLPSILLRKGESYADRYHRDGPSVLLHRSTDDGQVHAFSNICRHRGSQLLKDRKHTKGTTISCPYHAWTYDASSGALKGITRQKKCFPNVDKDQFSLHPVLSCFEQAGYIWVGGSETKDQRLWSLSEADSELSAILPTPSEEASSSPLLAYREWTLDANWQVLVETFLEAYHVSTLHKSTLATVAHSVMDTDVLDERSFRMSVPLRNFDADLYDCSDDESLTANDESFFEQTTTTYFLFPHTAISISKRFLFFVSIDPLGTADHPSRMSRIRTWGVQRTTKEDTSTALRDFENLTAGIDEDWHCAEDITRGLMNAVTLGLPQSENAYGLHEGGNVLFLKNVGDVAKLL